MRVSEFRAAVALGLFLLASILSPSYAGEQPMRVAVIGLTHTHVHWILGRPDLGDIQIVGIVESNTELAQRYAKQHGFSMDLVYPDMKSLVGAVEFEAVTAFGSNWPKSSSADGPVTPRRARPRSRGRTSYAAAHRTHRLRARRASDGR